MRVVSERVPRLATGDGLGLQHQQCPSSLGWAYCFQLMRGDILGPTVRCLYECWAKPSGLLRHAGEAVVYFMAVTPIARSLGRQWPPIEWSMQGGRVARCRSASICPLTEWTVVMVHPSQDH